MAGQDVFENEMKLVDSVDYLRGLKEKDSVLLNPGNLPYPNTGGSYTQGHVSSGKWYRIAVGGVGGKTTPSCPLCTTLNCSPFTY